MKKIVALVLALCLCLTAFAALADGVAKENIKLGVITLHDELSTYDKNFIDAAKEAAANMGLTEDQIKIVSGIQEEEICYTTAAELAEDGYNIIFADSFGHEDFMIKAAQEFPEVEFCHATGTKAHTEKLANFHNAFASIYEGRFLAGVAAGMKLKQLQEEGKLKGETPLMGYVGAFPYEEVKSGYTSFFLGAKSIVPEVQMKVIFTQSWYDEEMEKTAAKSLIAANCDLISQHADSWGAPTACEEAGIPNVSYNMATVEHCPNTFIVASRINWVPYFEYIISQRIAGEPIDTDWTGSIKTGSVELLGLNEQAAAPGTAEKIAEVMEKLQNGEVKVFDTATFTVNGETLTTSMANVDSDPAYEPDTEAIADGYFHESEFRSAPYFGLDIDGIEILNN
jgi:basic membrane protein A